MASLKILEISQLTPPPGSLATRSSLPLTFYDILFLYTSAVERIFFFPLPFSTSHFISTILPNLKSSLSQALDIFYPLYGKIRRYAGIDVDKLELNYVDGDSVSFVVAQMDGENFDDLSSNHARDVKRLLPLLPELGVESSDEAKQVLAIQVTLFPNQGITIGITIHHAACDGHTSTKFLSTWASICRQGSSSFSPLFDRTIISDPNDNYSRYLRACKSFSSSLATAPSNDMVCRTFTLTSVQIQRLKDIVANLANDDNGTPLRFSTITVTYALVWICLVKARKYASDRKVYITFAGNGSHGQQPPIPPEYFGNRIGGMLVQATADELCQDEGFIVAAKSINKAIKKFKENPLYIGEEMKVDMVSIASSKPLSVAGSPQLRVYDIDFGWGKPKKVEVTSILETGAMSVAESRDDQGGVEVGFILPKQEMDEFATQFSSGLKMLSLENDC